MHRLEIEHLDRQFHCLEVEDMRVSILNNNNDEFMI